MLTLLLLIPLVGAIYLLFLKRNIVTNLMILYIKNFTGKLDINSIKLGIIKGYSVNTLPDNFYLKYNHIYVRILRFIGGFCLLLSLTHNYVYFPIYLHTPILVIGFLQSIQILFILIFKFIYGIYTIKNKKGVFEVRNSPLNTFATHIAKIVFCAKVGCAITGGAAAVIAGGASYDQVLEAAGREKVFVPMMGEIYKSVFGEVIPNNNINTLVKSIEPKSDNSVTEMVKRYYQMNENEKLEFKNEIKKEVE